MQFSSSTERLAKFRWCMASGKHLFPFRTEQLSHSAPMVLGGQPPGRVGRRRFFLRGPGPRIAAARMPPIYCALGALHEARVSARPGPRTRRLGTEKKGAFDLVWASGPRRSGGQRAAMTGFAIARCLLSGGLEAVLAEGGEVDQEVNGVGQPGTYVFV